MPTKKITDLTQLTDLDATDSFVVNDSGAGADKRVEFSDLQSEVLNGAAIGTSTAITELQVDNLNLNGNTFSSTDTNGNILIQPNGTGATVINESGAASDFRVEGDTDQNLLFVDASTDRVGIGTATPASLLDVDGDLTITDKIIHSGDTNTAIRFPSADTVTVETAGSERMRIDSSGNVGIGASSKSNAYPADFRTLFIHSPSGDVFPILEFSGNRSAATGNQNAMIQFWNKTSTPVEVGRITSAQGSASNTGDIIFHTATTGTISEKVRILAGGGITFNGDTAAANALDDYEEGTWTPTYTTDGTDFSSITYSGAASEPTGRYTKIGNVVYITGQIRTSSITIGSASGNLLIGNLPFTSVSEPTVFRNGRISGDYTPFGSGWGTVPIIPEKGRVNTGDTTIRLLAHDYTNGDGTVDSIDATLVGTGANSNGFNFSGFYFTS